MDFSDICENSSHHAVYYDQHGYLICDLDRKYVYADGRVVTFTRARDLRHYILTGRRLEVIFGKGLKRAYARES